MGRTPQAIIFRNKLYASVDEAARLTNYPKHTIRKAVYGKKDRGRRMSRVQVPNPS